MEFDLKIDDLTSFSHIYQNNNRFHTPGTSLCVGIGGGGGAALSTTGASIGATEKNKKI
jgi:hypothetical protein